MIRSGLVLSASAAALAIVSAVAVVATTSTEEHRLFVTQLAVFAVVAFSVLLVAGARQLLGWTSIPLLGSAAFEAGFGADPSWIRSLLIGCLWYLAVEMGWDALDEREDTTTTRRARIRRVQELAAVVGTAVTLGLVAILAVSFAPVRSVALQATVLLLVLAALLVTVRHLSAGGGRAHSGRTIEK